MEGAIGQAAAAASSAVVPAATAAVAALPAAASWQAQRQLQSTLRHQAGPRSLQRVERQQEQQAQQVSHQQQAEQLQEQQQPHMEQVVAEQAQRQAGDGAPAPPPPGDGHSPLPISSALANLRAVEGTQQQGRQAAATELAPALAAAQPAPGAADDDSVVVAVVAPPPAPAAPGVATVLRTCSACGGKGHYTKKCPQHPQPPVPAAPGAAAAPAEFSKPAAPKRSHKGKAKQRSHKGKGAQPPPPTQQTDAAAGPSAAKTQPSQPRQSGGRARTKPKWMAERDKEAEEEHKKKKEEAQRQKLETAQRQAAAAAAATQPTQQAAPRAAAAPKRSHKKRPAPAAAPGAAPAAPKRSHEKPPAAAAATRAPLDAAPAATQERPQWCDQPTGPCVGAVVWYQNANAKPPLPTAGVATVEALMHGWVTIKDKATGKVFNVRKGARAENQKPEPFVEFYVSLPPGTALKKDTAAPKKKESKAKSRKRAADSDEAWGPADPGDRRRVPKAPAQPLPPSYQRSYPDSATGQPSDAELAVLDDRRERNARKLRYESTHGACPLAPMRTEGQVVRDAPVFFPTREEFADLLGYIESIRAEAEPFGQCKVVPPVDRRPQSALDDRAQLKLFVHKLRMQLPGTDAVAPHELPRRFTIWSFQALARDNAKNRCPQACRETPAATEAEFWNIVHQNSGLTHADYTKSAVERRSPADGYFAQCLTTMTRASGGSSKGAAASWNLQSLSSEPRSVLQHLPYEVKGITTPKVTANMLFSASAWQLSQNFLYSISYIHTGEPITRYATPSADTEEMHALIRSKMCLPPTMSIHAVGSTLIAPEEVARSGLQPSRLMQSQGEFVVTYPKAYSASFSHGYNVDESVNFGTLDWVPHGRDAVAFYSTPEGAQPGAILQDELVCTLVRKFDRSVSSVESSLKPLLNAMRQELLADIEEAKRMGLQIAQLDEHSQKLQSARCMKCRRICFLVGVSNARLRDCITCVQHTASLECAQSDMRCLVWEPPEELAALAEGTSGAAPEVQPARSAPTAKPAAKQNTTTTIDFSKLDASVLFQLAPAALADPDSATDSAESATTQLESSGDDSTPEKQAVVAVAAALPASAQPETERRCSACQGAHRAHTCGKGANAHTFAV